MYVLSQDRLTLVNCNVITAIDSIIYTTVEGMRYDLGVYPSPERAAEVINAIVTRVNYVSRGVKEVGHVIHMPEK